MGHDPWLQISILVSSHTKDGSNLIVKFRYNHMDPPESPSPFQ